MPGVRYIARSALVPGHVSGGRYFLPVEFSDAIRSREPDKDMRRTLSGRLETRHHRTDTLWNLQFRPMQFSDRQHVEEFLESVQGGEPFDVFLYDDGPPLHVERVDPAHEWSPFMPVGSRRLDWNQPSSITVREVD